MHSLRGRYVFYEKRFSFNVLGFFAHQSDFGILRTGQNSMYDINSLTFLGRVKEETDDTEAKT